MYSITEDLLNELKNTSDLDSFFKANENMFINQTFSEYLNDIIKIKDITISSVASASGAGEYIYKVFKGERNPSRDVLISISFGMELSLDETQFLLRLAKFATLDSRTKRDSIIIFGITHNKTVFQTDDLLLENNELTIL